MAYQRLLANLGFNSDPFSKTNADEEERLEDYFIPPPFFNAVFGNPEDPKASIVFAPRGGGKTALKRKIELSSINKNFLCITYNQFDTAGIKLGDIDFEYHCNNIIKLILIAILTALGNQGVESLSKDDRHFIYIFIKNYFQKLDQHKLKDSIKNVKNFSDTAKDWWNKFTGPIGIVINGVLSKIGLGEAEIKEFQEKGGQIGNKFQQLDKLYEISEKLGYKSIYVLIDKVDETDITGTSDKSYKFISSILGNLQFLELKGYSFKFFLWDLLLDHYREVARPDRIKYYRLQWTPDQLENMLSARLAAYSEGRVTSLQSLCDFESNQTIDRVITFLANESPRNTVRISKSIVDQQSEIDSEANLISEIAINKGISQISEDMSHEMYSDSIINDLLKVSECDFTVRRLYVEVFKFSQQAALKKIQTWESSGAVQNVGTTQETKGAKPSNLYIISNPILAKHIFDRQSVKDFINNKVKICESCEKILLRDWGKRSVYNCQECQSEISSTKIGQ